jgi:MFS family permease
MQAGERPDACETEPAGPAVATVEPERPVRGAFVLAAIAFSLAGFISWGIPLQLIPVLTELGHSEAAAVAVGVLFGPAQVVARFGELTFGHRVGILLIGVGAIGLLPVGLLVILTGGHTIAGAVAFAVIYGIAAGLVSVVRAVAPLRLFGRSRYARITGYLNAPQNLAFAAGPFAFAALREAFGFTAVTLSAMAVGLVAFAAMLELNRRAGRSSRPSQNAGTGPDGPRPR